MFIKLHTPLFVLESDLTPIEKLLKPQWTEWDPWKIIDKQNWNKLLYNAVTNASFTLRLLLRICRVSDFDQD